MDLGVNLPRQLSYILDRREKFEAFLLLCSMALGALFEAVSIGLVVPFIAVLKDPQIVFRSAGARTLFGFVDIHDDRQILIATGAALVSIFVVKSAYLILLYRWQFRYIFATYERLGRRLLSGYLNAPYLFHLQRNSAELIKVATESIQRFAAGFLVSLLTVLGEVLVVSAVAILLMLVEPLATLAAILVLGIPTVLMYGAMRRPLASSGHMVEQSYSATIQWVQQGISGIKETLVTGRAAFFVDRYAYHLSRVSKSMRAFNVLSSIPRLVIDTLAVSAMVIFVLIVLARGQDLQATLPVLTMFAVAVIRLMPSTSRIANALAQLRFHYAAAAVLYQELAETKEQGLERSHQRVDGIAASRLPFRHSIVLEHLCFRYPSAPVTAINDVCIEIRKGHWVALVGPTGAGKTTLADLILGLFVPTSGRIMIDGHELRDSLAGWQRNIGLIPQSIYLLDDTVRQNVGFGLRDEQIEDERVWRALRDAGADQLVRSLPGGLDAENRRAWRPPFGRRASAARNRAGPLSRSGRADL